MIKIVPGDLITVNKLGMALPVYSSLYKPRRSFGNVTCMMPCLVIAASYNAIRVNLLIVSALGVGWLLEAKSGWFNDLTVKVTDNVDIRDISR